jgi:hypothetical protein
MAVPARLTRVLQRVLGDEGGDDLVTWMVQVDANRSELRDMIDLWTARVDAQFAGVDARFADVDSRFDRVDARFAEVDARFDRMEARFAALEKRFEVGFAEYREALTAGLAQVNERMAALELRVADRIANQFKWSFIFWCGTIGAIVLSAIVNSRH